MLDRFPPSLRVAVLEALAVVLPVACPGCGRLDAVVCDRCRSACDGLVRRERLGEVPVWFALDYAGVVAKLLVAFKNEGRTTVAGALAAPFARAVDAALAGAAGREEPLVVAIPGRRSSRRRRGYGPVEVLAGRAGVVLSPGLRFVRQPVDQRRLGRRERAENLALAMVATPRVSGRRVVIVDDVLTTGATIAEAARAVCESGGEVVGAAVLARTRRGRRTVGLP